jgi:gliding motility-associated-like protein
MLKNKIVIMQVILLCMAFINPAFGQGPCTPATITSMSPLSGPANTVVTLTGSGFMAGTGTSFVKFNGVAATAFTIISDTQIKATVPANASTGTTTIVTNNCTATAPVFTVVSTNCPPVVTAQDIYISEVYDQKRGSGGMIELYNPTESTIVFNGRYILQRYGDIDDDAPSTGYILQLTGSIASESTYLVACVTPDESICAASPQNASFGNGFNGNDRFELLKNNIIIDAVNVPFTAAGFTLIRQPDAIAPAAEYNQSDWNNFQHDNVAPNNYCADLGNHVANPAPTSPMASITSQPQSQNVCENTQATFTVSLSEPAGFTYQWKMLNAIGIWVNVTNNNNTSGATTNTLIINQVSLSNNNTQYYCQVTAGSCTLVSNAAQLTVSSLPVVILAAIQPSCSLPAGTIAITPVSGTGLTYKLDNGTYQAENTFTNVSPGTHTVTVKNTEGCTSDPATVVINAVPAAPAMADLILTQPTCAIPTSTITVNTPTGTELTYQLDNGAYQAETSFTNVAPGVHTVTVKNAQGCTSAPATVTINAVPAAPAMADLILTHPTCAIPTGTITLNMPTGTELTYQLDNGAYQAETSFTNVAPGVHTVTVKNAQGCTSAPATVTINAVPAAPAMADLIPTQPTCAIPTGTITVNTPTGTELTYQLDNGAYQAETSFNNVAPGMHTVTVKNAQGCTSAPATVTINAVPAAPAMADLILTQPTCAIPTGTITVNTPTGRELTYQLDNGAYQAETSFTNVPPGTHTVTVKNAEGCTSAPVTVTIVPAGDAPQVTTVQGCVETGSGRKYILQAMPFSNSFDGETASFEWTVAGNISPDTSDTFNLSDYAAHMPTGTLHYPVEITVNVLTAGGCETTAAFTVDGIFCDIPKGISPNGDGSNDSFNLAGLNVNSMTVFNRYGQEVYSRNNYINEWFGQSANNDELPTGTYYYVIALTGGITQTGWVYVNRQEN